MKKFLIIIGIILVVLIAAVLLFLGSIIKTSVTTIGPKVAGVPIELERVSVNPFTGTVRLKGLVVGNPEGFKTPSAMELGEFKVKVDLKSVLSDTIVIKEILINEPGITYERALRGSNLSRIQDNLSAGGGEKQTPAAPAAETADAEAKPAKKVIIEDFQINGAKVKISITGAGGYAATLPLPTIHMTDIGKDKGGAKPVDAVKQICSEVFSSVGNVVTSAGNIAGDAVKNVGDATKDAAKGVTDATKDAASSIKKGVGNLFQRGE